MLHLILSWILSALLLLLLSRVLPGFRLRGFGTALVAVIVIAFLNATLGLLLKMVAFPLTILTLGLFLVVINAVVLKAAAALLPGFSVRGFAPALIASILLSLIHFFLRASAGVISV